MKLTVSQKGMAFVAVPLLFQMAFVLVVFTVLKKHVAAERLTAHTKDVIAQAHDVRNAVADAHAGVRGYVLTGNDEFAEPFRHARGELPGLLNALAQSVDDNPDQIARVAKVRAAAEDILGRLGEIESLVVAGAADRAADRVRAGNGNGAMTVFRRELAEFLSEENRLDAVRLADLERTRSLLDVLLTAGGAAAVGCTLALGYAFRRGIARRFAALEATTRRLATGEGLPPPLGGGDEIAALDRAFRDMAEQLKAASAEARDLYDHAPCGYHSLAPDGTFLAVNQTELAWLGYSADELVGRKRFTDLLPDEGRRIFAESFPRFKETGEVRDVEFDLVRKDGTVFPVLLNATAVRDAAGNYLRSRTTLTDLTERKRAEAAVRLFADLARNVPIGLLIYRLDSVGDPPILRVRSANPGAIKLLGVPLETAVGQPVVAVFPQIPDDQLRRFTAVAAGGPADDLGVFRYGDVRVAERWWAVVAFPLPDKSVGVAFQDVSDRERALAEIRVLNADLESRVRERTADLEAANRELVQKNAENEMFVYSVSHDLRSPLVNLQGFSRELEKAAKVLAGVFADPAVPPDVRDRGTALLDGKVAKSIGFILTAVLRLSGIIDALLRLSRAGRVEYRWERVDVAAVVANVVGAAQGTIADRGIAVRVGDLAPAWGDRTAVEQVFANLIGNAVTYLDPARPGIIDVDCVPDCAAGTVTYAVRDNGLGIPEAHRTRIFQAFQRAHPGVGSGEGLGLAIVARVIERHRGRVWVASNTGSGTIFYVTLPAPAGTTERR